MECVYLLIMCDEPRRPRRGAPAADQLPVNSSRSLKRVFCVWHWYFHNFHGLGANARSCTFHQSALWAPGS